MKAFIAILLGLTLTLSAATQASHVTTEIVGQFNLTEFGLVVQGVLEGIGAAENFTEIQGCLVTSEQTIGEIVTAVQDFEKKDPISVAQGLAILGKALGQVPVAVRDCKGAVQDVEKLINSLKAIVSPTSFIFNAAKNLLINGVDIYHEIYTAVDDFKTQNWEQFGYNIGEALAQVFLYGVPQTTNGIIPIKDILLFLEGVVQGVSANTNFTELAACLNDAANVGVQIDQAVNDFIAATPEKVIEGVKLLGQTIQIIPQAAQECKVALDDLKQIAAALAELKDPRTLIYKIGRSLILNGQEILDDVTAVSRDWRAGNYLAAGNDVGTLLSVLINPANAKITPKFNHFVSERASFEIDYNSKYANWTIGEIKTRLLGTKIQDLSKTKAVGVDYTDVLMDVPQNFSAYDQWPECKLPILDQAQCGSCWAFSAAETLSHRFCVATQGKIDVTLSPQWLVSCSFGNMGCNGGTLTLAWESLVNSGLPTLACDPYVSGDGKVPSCASQKQLQCADGTTRKNYFAKSWSIRWYMNADSIKKEILQNGPVQTAFTVYEDFMSYKGGVYKHTTGAALGGHAVKIVGWGNEDGEDYWLVANSWGPDWGINGFFKYALGQGMDGNGVAGLPDVAKAEAQTQTHAHKHKFSWIEDFFLP